MTNNAASAVFPFVVPTIDVTFGLRGAVHTAIPQKPLHTGSKTYFVSDDVPGTHVLEK